MNKSLQLVSEIGEGRNKDLLLELPQELAAGLNIQSDGRVDTKQLLDIFTAILRQEQNAASDNDHLSIQEKIDLLLNIYDDGRSEK